MKQPTERELEALLLTAARLLGVGAVAVDPDRARAFGVPVGALTQAGAVIAGSQTKAPVTGYYCPRSSPLGVPRLCLLTSIDGVDEADRYCYRLVVLREDSTGHFGLGGDCELYSRREYAAHLRGIIACARQARP